MEVEGDSTREEVVDSYRRLRRLHRHHNWAVLVVGGNATSLRVYRHPGEEDSIVTLSRMLTVVFSWDGGMQWMAPLKLTGGRRR